MTTQPDGLASALLRGGLRYGKLLFETSVMTAMNPPQWAALELHTCGAWEVVSRLGSREAAAVCHCLNCFGMNVRHDAEPSVLSASSPSSVVVLAWRAPKEVQVDQSFLKEKRKMSLAG